MRDVTECKGPLQISGNRMGTLEDEYNIGVGADRGINQ